MMEEQFVHIKKHFVLDGVLYKGTIQLTLFLHEKSSEILLTYDKLDYNWKEKFPNIRSVFQAFSNPEQILIMPNMQISLVEDGLMVCHPLTLEEINKQERQLRTQEKWRKQLD